ncbi:hypothetical protein GCM10017786_03930 [Amycolatopsis deserti]|uniref:Uncharacterized protein n=1 Tax=Amycolatopsis deserti TaxID=185696 RepID=A0ABQ3IE87_9PSEU|nr:hypothetical protein [Amycolatopsis deserti]GHE77642.1 hypothetical protein GCM10017786_03930 [Amycolatopsis deserti]
MITHEYTDAAGTRIHAEVTGPAGAAEVVCGPRRLLATVRYLRGDPVETKLPAVVVRGSRDPIVPGRGRWRRGCRRAGSSRCPAGRSH